MVRSISRRRLLQTVGSVTAIAVAGCAGDTAETSSPNTATDTRTPAGTISAKTIGLPSGDPVAARSAEFYRELSEALAVLKTPWTASVTTPTRTLILALREELVGILRPGVREFLPASGGDDRETVSLVRATTALFESVHRDGRELSTDRVRSFWKTVPRQQLAPYYEALSVSIAESEGTPYLKLFDLVLEDLDDVLQSDSDRPVNGLVKTSHGVHRLLDELVLPRIEVQVPRATSLLYTLRLLDVVAETVVNATERPTPTV